MSATFRAFAATPTVFRLGRAAAALAARRREQDEVIAALGAPLQQREALLVALREQNTQLQEPVRQLQEQLDDLHRTTKRQATPFARRKHGERPRRAGRKKGPGKFSWRCRPPPAEVRETKAAPRDNCLACGGPLRARKEHE